MVAKLRDKTLITKDGDTLLQAANRGAILAEARDLYDRVARTHYKNQMGKNYEGINLTWILCGTKSLDDLDHSELGERFINCRVIDEIDPDMEHEVGWRVVNQALQALRYEVNGNQETADTPEKIKAKRLTGGYVTYLRENANKLLMAVDCSDEVLQRCQTLGLFAAHLRTKPTGKPDEKAEREVAYRLQSQYVRLAVCLAAVMQKESVDDEVMARVKACALDTSRGRPFEAAKRLHGIGRKGMTANDLASFDNDTPFRAKGLLRFMRKLGIVETFVIKHPNGQTSKPRWRMTERFAKVYEEVINRA